MPTYPGTAYEYAANDPRTAGSAASRYWAAHHIPLPGEGVSFIQGQPGYRWDEGLRRAVDIPGTSVGHPLYGTPRVPHWSEIAGNQMRDLASQRQGMIQGETASQGSRAANLLRAVLAQQGMGGGADQTAALSMLSRGTGQATAGAQNEATMNDSERINALNSEARARTLQEYLRLHGQSNQEDMVRLLSQLNNRPDYSWVGGAANALGGMLGGSL